MHVKLISHIIILLLYFEYSSETPVQNEPALGYYVMSFKVIFQSLEAFFRSENVECYTFWVISN